MSDTKQNQDDEGPCEYRGKVYANRADLARVIGWRVVGAGSESLYDESGYLKKPTGSDPFGLGLNNPYK